jgi:hypothetical protein
MAYKFTNKNSMPIFSLMTKNLATWAMYYLKNDTFCSITLHKYKSKLLNMKLSLLKKKEKKIEIEIKPKNTYF